MDFSTIKAAYDLEELIIEKLGEPENNKWLCPFHQEKTASFTVWAGGERYKCFGCGAEGDIFDFVMRYDNLPGVKQAIKKLGNGYVWNVGLNQEQKAKQEQARAERLVAKQIAQQTALDKVAKLTDKVEWYHSRVSDALDYWQTQGISQELIDKHKLGFAPLCPLLYPDEVKQASYVLPCWRNGALLSIRHRLSQPNGHGKYRPEFKGLPPQLYNVDSITANIPFLLPPEHGILVEGEIKSLVIADKLGCGCVGLPGITTWQPDWAELFKPLKTIFLIPDPGLNRAIKLANVERIASSLQAAGMQVILVTVPAKPDDLFVKMGVGPARFIRYLERGRLWQ